MNSSFLNYRQQNNVWFKELEVSYIIALFSFLFNYRTGTSLSGGKIAGIVIAGILITTILILVIICFMVPLLRV